MSWVLKHKKRTAIFILLVLILAAGTIVYINLHFNLIVLVAFYLMLIVGICLNEMVIRKMWEMQEPFQPLSQIRNVDYLIIGDQCDPSVLVPEDKTYVQIAAPNRGFNSAYQILRHTHSILKEEGGTVILPCGNNTKDFMIFDIPFLHPITIKKYHLERLKMKSKMPLIFAPVDSIRFLLEGGKHTYTYLLDVNPELIAFCEERNYSLFCYKGQ